MKFARYLQDTQTPEWKRAYIDYRGLKKRITAIRRWQDGVEPITSSDDAEADNEAEANIPQTSSPTTKSDSLPTSIPVAHNANSIASSSNVGHAEEVAGSDEDEDKDGDVESMVLGSRPSLSSVTPRVKNASRRALTLPNPDRSPSSPLSTRTPSKPKPLARRQTSVLSIHARHKIDEHTIPLHVLLPTLPEVHLKFFSYLDSQLEKIEKFYDAREKEAQARTKALHIQLEELKDHRKAFHEAYPDTGNSWSDTFRKVIPSTTPFSAITAPDVTGAARRLSDRLAKPKPKPKPHGPRDSQATDAEFAMTTDSDSGPKGKERESGGEGPSTQKQTQKKQGLDPEEYQDAKKKLKKAVLEHYRGLEVLNNYRILNITGFRKALKKYEKVTGVPAQHAYMKEKVETSAFSSDVSVVAMLKGMEDLYAARFARGDKKRATVRLRAASQHRSHHFSTFRSGLAIGIALPAFASGVYQSFQPEKRAAIPSWDALMYIYGVLLVPVLFSLLVGTNLEVWSKARINYAFIFELDVRTQLDHREYFEIPAYLLAGLMYAFWLSFSHIGPPTLWPLIWLAVTFAVMFNPLPILFKSSRWWLLRSVGELLISGAHHVEFTDFWMGDQFCSLIFTLANLYFFACSYANDFHSDTWEKCGTQSQAGWGVAFAVGILPLLSRLIQSIRRYYDSGLITHLINGGKYATGIVFYLFYYLWRHAGEPRGVHLILMCFWGTAYAVYACTWDFLMDWSFFKRKSKYPLLRPDLAYSHEIPLYYFALISNLLIRFVWVLYIPQRGPSIRLRTFIAAMLEMLRRWQWNFYRLENEHIGNMDQYRVTREVPLPYHFEDQTPDDDDDADEDNMSTRSKWLRRRLKTSSAEATLVGDGSPS